MSNDTIIDMAEKKNLHHIRYYCSVQGLMQYFGQEGRIIFLSLCCLKITTGENACNKGNCWKLLIPCTELVLDSQDFSLCTEIMHTVQSIIQATALSR